MKLRVTMLALLFAIVSSATAAPAPSDQDAAPVSFDDPALQVRYEQLTREFRCLVCQNQSIADSHAFLAGDLRLEVADQLRAGRSDEQIVAFMVARYGDFVLYKPPLQDDTLPLWIGPFLLLVVGGVAVGIVVRRRAAIGADDGTGDGP